MILAVSATLGSLLQILASALLTSTTVLWSSRPAASLSRK